MRTSTGSEEGGKGGGVEMGGRVGGEGGMCADVGGEVVRIDGNSKLLRCVSPPLPTPIQQKLFFKHAGTDGGEDGGGDGGDGAVGGVGGDGVDGGDGGFDDVDFNSSDEDDGDKVCGVGWW